MVCRVAGVRYILGVLEVIFALQPQSLGRRLKSCLAVSSGADVSHTQTRVISRIVQKWVFVKGLLALDKSLDHMSCARKSAIWVLNARRFLCRSGARSFDVLLCVAYPF